MVGVEDCIQLLATESAQPSYTSLDSGLSHAYPLDDGRAIWVSFRDRGIVGLLEMETMRTLARYDVRPHDASSYYTPRVLCTSIDGNITALCFPAYFCGCTSRLKNIGGTPFHLEQHLPRPPISAVFSPSGDNLIIVVEQGVSDEDRGWELWIWRGLKRSRIWHTQNQHALYVRLDTQAGKPPSDIAFISETEFYTEDRHTRESSAPSSDESKDEVHYKDCYVRKHFSIEPIQCPTGIRALSEEKVLPSPHLALYELDEDLEWVVNTKSRRVCWLPPGYVSGIEGGHFFVGSSIVMAGQDGIVRKLTFGEPRSDS